MTSNLRFAARKDSNHNKITEGFIEHGYEAYDTHKQGEGFPDTLVVSKTRIPVLFEIKLFGQRLTKAERVFHKSYQGPLHVIVTLSDGLMWMEFYDQQKIDIPE